MATWRNSLVPREYIAYLMRTLAPWECPLLIPRVWKQWLAEGEQGCPIGAFVYWHLEQMEHYCDTSLLTPTQYAICDSCDKVQCTLVSCLVVHNLQELWTALLLATFLLPLGDLTPRHNIPSCKDRVIGSGIKEICSIAYHWWSPLYRYCSPVCWSQLIILHGFMLG